MLPTTIRGNRSRRDDSRSSPSLSPCHLQERAGLDRPRLRPGLQPSPSCSGTSSGTGRVKTSPTGSAIGRRPVRRLAGRERMRGGGVAFPWEFGVRGLRVGVVDDSSLAPQLSTPSLPLIAALKRIIANILVRESTSPKVDTKGFQIPSNNRVGPGFEYY